MSWATVSNCQHNTPDPEGLRAMSSRQSGQQQKTPDSRTCWAGSVLRRVDDCWPNADAGGKRRQKLVSSGPSGTDELGCVGNGARAHQACTWLVLQRQANEAQRAWVVTRDRPWSNFCVSLTTRAAVFTVQHSLQPLCYILRRPSEDCIAVIHAGRHESMDKCRSRFGVKWSSDRRMRRSCRSPRNPAAQKLPTCLTRLRSDEMVTPRTWTSSLAAIVSTSVMLTMPQSRSSCVQCSVVDVFSNC